MVDDGLLHSIMRGRRGGRSSGKKVRQDEARRKGKETTAKLCNK